MRSVSVVVFFVCMALAGCDRSPESYPPPEQYHSGRPADPPMLLMGSPNAEAWILGDVHEQNIGYGARWTGAHPRFAFRLKPSSTLDLLIHFEVHSIPFSHTGPITIRILVNDEQLDKVRYDSPDIHDYVHAVPEKLLQAANPVVVALEIDPAWRQDDKNVYGLLLSYIGFREHEE